MAQVRFAMRPAAPFRLDLTAWALRRRAHNQIDRFEDGVYRRVAVLGGAPAEISVAQVAPPENPQLEVTVACEDGPAASIRGAAKGAVERLLGTDRDLSGFYRMARRDRLLAPMAERLLGMKPPRFLHRFEALTNAVACQLLSLTVGLTILNRLAKRSGARHFAGGRAAYGFALPTQLVRMRPASLLKIGFSRAKARTLIELARFDSRSNGSDFAQLEALDDRAAIELLCGFKGVGRWTAEYVLLRGLGRLNVFPCDDVGGRNALARWLGVKRALDYGATQRLVARWAPYQGFVYMHLLVNALLDSGAIEPGGAPRTRDAAAL